MRRWECIHRKICDRKSFAHFPSKDANFLSQVAPDGVQQWRKSKFFISSCPAFSLQPALFYAQAFWRRVSLLELSLLPELAFWTEERVSALRARALLEQPQEAQVFS